MLSYAMVIMYFDYGHLHILGVGFHGFLLAFERNFKGVCSNASQRLLTTCTKTGTCSRFLYFTQFSRI